MQFEFVNHRRAPDIESQPFVELCHWRIVQRGNKDMHLATQMNSGSLRVTSKLQCIELAQGSSERNLGAAIDFALHLKRMRCFGAFYCSSRREICKW